MAKAKAKKATKSRAKVQSRRRRLPSEGPQRQFVRSVIKQLDAIDSLGRVMNHIVKTDLERGKQTEFTGLRLRRLQNLCTLHGLGLPAMLKAHTGYAINEGFVEDTIKNFEASCAALGIELSKPPRPKRYTIRY